MPFTHPTLGTFVAAPLDADNVSERVAMLLLAADSANTLLDSYGIVPAEYDAVAALARANRTLATFAAVVFPDGNIPPDVASACGIDLEMYARAVAFIQG